jgi:hypothetical protein
MSYIHDDILDAAASYISSNTENLYITNDTAPPSTYSFASTTGTYACGVKATPSFTGPADGDTSGRKITVDAISDGSVNDTATADYWALTDNSLTKLLVWGDLSAPQAVTNGNTFTLTAADVEFPDPA